MPIFVKHCGFKCDTFNKLCNLYHSKWVRIESELLSSLLLTLYHSHRCLCYEAITTEALLTSSFTCACFSSVLRVSSTFSSQTFLSGSENRSDQPSATRRWPPDKSISGVYWGCVWSRHCFDPSSTQGWYTQVRKREASYYLCSLRAPVFRFGLDGLSERTDDRHIFPSSFTWHFLTSPLYCGSTW